MKEKRRKKNEENRMYITENEKLRNFNKSKREPNEMNQEGRSE